MSGPVLLVGGLAGPGPIAGGVWSVARAQTAALRESGVDARLIGGWRGEPPTPDYVELKELFPGAGLRGLYSRHVKSFLRRSIAGARIAHVHLSRDYLTTTALKHFRDVPIVAQAHGMIGPAKRPEIRAFDAIFGDRIRTAPTVWLSLTDNESACLHDFGVPEGRIRRIDNAVDDALLRGTEEPSPTVGVSFLFLSRLHARKQPDVFVQAGSEAARRISASFTIAGPDQGERERVEKLISESHVRSAFSLRGSLSPEESAEAMRACSVFVLPSRGEIAPMVAIEAAAAGRAIILTDDCGIAEDFRAADAAVVVSANVRDVADAMVRLGSDRALRQQLGRNARALYEQRWSLPSLARSLMSIYEEIDPPHQARLEW